MMVNIVAFYLGYLAVVEEVLLQKRSENTP
jgi:hypothetical protein